VEEDFSFLVKPQGEVLRTLGILRRNKPQGSEYLTLGLEFHIN
jgi:hypothetical protein